MRAVAVILTGVIGWGLLGCDGKSTRRDTTPPADMPLLASIRMDIQRTDPNALVGYVTQTLPKERLAAVGQVPVNQFRIGQVLVFIDVRQNRLTTGMVRRITSDELHVQYQPPPKDGREPRVGDLAVRFKTSP